MAPLVEALGLTFTSLASLVAEQQVSMLQVLVDKPEQLGGPLFLCGLGLAQENEAHEANTVEVSTTSAMTFATVMSAAPGRFFATASSRNLVVKVPLVSADLS